MFGGAGSVHLTIVPSRHLRPVERIDPDTGVLLPDEPILRGRALHLGRGNVEVRGDYAVVIRTQVAVGQRDHVAEHPAGAAALRVARFRRTDLASGSPGHRVRRAVEREAPARERAVASVGKPDRYVVAEGAFALVGPVETVLRCRSDVVRIGTVACGRGPERAPSAEDLAIAAVGKDDAPRVDGVLANGALIGPAEDRRGLGRWSRSACHC